MSNPSTGKLPIGSRVRVKDGVMSPDFADVSFAGWTATIMEFSGKKPNQKFIVVFDDAVIAAMPPGYLQPLRRATPALHDGVPGSGPDRSGVSRLPLTAPPKRKPGFWRRSRVDGEGLVLGAGLMPTPRGRERDSEEPEGGGRGET